MQRIFVRKLPQILTVSPILIHSHTLVHHKLKFKIVTRNSQLSYYSMVCGLCSVMISAWDKLGIQDWAPLSQNCRIRAGLVFMSRGRPYLHVPLLVESLREGRA
jgi:hypothetical protein